MEAISVYNKFNRGEVDEDALARDDVTKINNSCELMENFIPLRLGPMMYRPGIENLAPVIDEAYFAEFIASTSDVALLEFTNNFLRIWIDDEVLARTSVSQQIANPDFSVAGSWTDGSGAGSTATISGGYANLTGNTSTSAQLWQTVASTDTGSEHTVNVIVEQAPIIFKIGTTGQDSDEIFSGTLLPGEHSLVFTPASDVTITLTNPLPYVAKVNSVKYSGTGNQTFTTSIATAQLSTIRYSQSADIIYITYDNGKTIQIERRGVKSWSLVDYRVDDGPFDVINTTSITLAAGALSGDTTLTASSSYFKSGHVGSLFKLGSSGQIVTASVVAEDTGTNSIRVIGVGAGRTFTITATGFAGGTIVTLQRSTDDATWVDITTYAADVAGDFNDGLDNAISFYRLFVKTGDYGSGTATLTLEYTGGSVEGIARVSGFTSTTVVDVQVLTNFGSTEATKDWYASQWSEVEGYPTAVSLYEGRLWFAGKNNAWGSVSDAYTSFDRDIEGDSKSIFKTIGFGPVDSINWLSDAGRLLMGVASAEISLRSSSFGEVLTQNNINLKSGTTQGSAPIAPAKIDDKVYYSQRSEVKIMEAEYVMGKDTNGQRDLMTLNQNICSAGIKRIAVSRQPETRMFVVLNDGSARVYLFDQAEDVAAWSRITTPEGGLFEDVIVLPSTGEDRVYFVVQRGARYLEKMSKFSDAITNHTDAYKTYVSPGTTITGLSHLEGLVVNVWADDEDRGEFTVSGGSITVGSSWTNVVVGLKYNADYTSNKLGQYADYSVLTKRVRVFGLGMIIKNLYPGALQYGYDLDNLDPMPEIEDGTTFSSTTLINDYDHTPFEFDGNSEANSRVSLRATGPCKIMALTYGIKDSKRKTAKS